MTRKATQTLAHETTRRMRLLRLRRAVRAGRYHVPAKTVAEAILRQLGLSDHASILQQR